MDKEHLIEEFNKAINFTLDEAGDEGLTFLSCWREGDWGTIEKEFPDFKVSERLKNP
jgi:hypothetical protein